MKKLSITINILLAFVILFFYQNHKGNISIVEHSKELETIRLKTILDNMNSIEDVKTIPDKNSFDIHFITREYSLRLSNFELSFDKIEKPIILVLSSNRPSTWNIMNKDGINIYKVFLLNSKDTVYGIDNSKILNFNEFEIKNLNLPYTIAHRDILLDTIDKFKEGFGKAPKTIHTMKRNSYTISNDKTLSFEVPNTYYDTVSFINEKENINDPSLSLSLKNNKPLLYRKTDKAYSSGKWYYEFKIDDIDKYRYIYFGVHSHYFSSINNRKGMSSGYSYAFTDKSDFSSGDIIGVAMDLDNSKLYYGINGLWKVGNPESNIDGIDLKKDREYYPFFSLIKNKSVSSQNKSIDVSFTKDKFVYSIPNNYKAFIKSNTSKQDNNKKEVYSLYKKAKTTWGNTLNPDNKISKNKFLAFYINTKNPEKLIAREEVNHISINYNRAEEFHNIRPKNFGAYWVGEFYFDKDQTKELSISQSWSETRLIIDGNIVYNGKKSKSFDYFFTKGSHKIELEYINNWHTTQMNLIIQDKVKIHSLTEIKEYLKKNTDEKDKIWYLSAYESANKDNSIIITLQKSSDPVIIILSSYDSIRWDLRNPYNTKVKAILCSSNTPNSSIKIDKSDAIILYTEKINISSDLKPSYSLNSGVFHISDYGIKRTNNQIKDLTGKKIYGFTGKYRMRNTTLPSILLTKKVYKNIDDAYAEMRKVQNKEKLNVNNIFDN